MAHFRADVTQLKQYAEALNRSPKLQRAANSGFINNLAFMAKGKAFAQIKKGMVVRAPGFVSGSIRVKKAHPGNDSPRATVGSIERARFTGWPEQEYGTKATKWRTATQEARIGGSFAGKMKGAARLKTGNAIFKPGSGGALAAFSASPGWRKPFLLQTRIGRMNPGLYRFAGHPKRIVVNGEKVLHRPIVRLQHFRPGHRPIKPKRALWMTRAREETLRDTAGVERAWHRALVRTIRHAFR